MYTYTHNTPICIYLSKYKYMHILILLLFLLHLFSFIIIVAELYLVQGIRAKFLRNQKQIGIKLNLVWLKA